MSTPNPFPTLLRGRFDAKNPATQEAFDSLINFQHELSETLAKHIRREPLREQIAGQLEVKLLEIADVLTVELR